MPSIISPDNFSFDIASRKRRDRQREETERDKYLFTDNNRCKWVWGECPVGTDSLFHGVIGQEGSSLSLSVLKEEDEEVDGGGGGG